MQSYDITFRKIGIMYLIFLLVFTGIGGNIGIPVSYAAEEGTYVSSDGDDTTGDGTRENPYATLQKAFQAANDQGTIFIMDDITLMHPFPTLKVAKSVTITTASEATNTAVIKRGAVGGTGTGTLFDLENSHLTLRNIVIDGSFGEGPSQGRIINVNANAKLTIEDGTILQNNYSEYPGSAVILNGANAVLEMTGGEITGNSHRTFGAVLINFSQTRVIMTGGKITGNNGGGVHVRNNVTGDFILSGDAVITDNTIEGLERNVFLDGPNSLTLSSNFTGKAGITATNRMTKGSTFGLANEGTFTGLENLFADNDSSLFAVYGGGNALEWNSIDKTLLQEKVDEINGEDLNELNYTTESWQALLEALNMAQEALDNGESTQEEVDQALANLEAARNNLQVPHVTPGGVGDGLTSWVDVGKSSVRDNSDRVTKLQDLAFDRTWDVVGTSAQPYNASNINFNPGLTLDSTVGYYATSRFGQNDTAREIFSVQISRNHTGFPWEFGSNHLGSQYGLNKSQIRTSFFSTSNRTVNLPDKYNLLESRVLNIRSSNEEWSLSLDGNQLASFDNNAVQWSYPNLSTYYIGAGHNSRYNGSISEVILFNRVLTSVERQQVNSYLAIKYGLTLETDYLDSNEGIMWSAAANEDYSNRITGLGRDDNGALYQKQSVSNEKDSIVTIALGDTIQNSNEENGNTIWNDKSFFLFGDDGASTEFINPIDKTDESLKRMERVYKVQKTNWQDTNSAGEDSKITLQIEKVQGADEWPLYVIVSSDDHFGAEDSFYLIEDGKVTIDTKNFGPVSYFTIAATVPQIEGGSLEQTETEGTRIALTFDHEVNLSSLDGFTITVNGEEVAINEVTFEVDPNNQKQLVLTLPDGTHVTDKEVKVLYDGKGNLKGTNSVPVDGFEQIVTDEFASSLQITKPSEIAKTSKPIIEGTASPEATISIVIKDSEGNIVEDAGGTTTVDEDGNWYFTPNIDLEDGPYTVEVTALKDGRTATKAKEFIIESVDKTALESKVEEIKNLDAADYTEESWQELDKALSKAREVLDNDEAIQEEVDIALEQLNNAYESLTKWVPELLSVEVNVQDKIELIFDKSIDLDNIDGFTVEVNGLEISITDFEINGETLTLLLDGKVEEGNSVKVIYKKEEGNLRGTNGEPVASFEKEATNNVPVNKTSLQSKVEEINTENLQDKDYTEESWQELQSKLREAQEVLENPDASQADVNEALDKLELAYNSLTKWVPELETTKANELDKIEFTFDNPIVLDNLDGFTIEVNGQHVVVTDFKVNGDKLTLLLPEAVEGGSAVRVTYDADTGNIRGTNGEPVKSFEKELTVVDKSALEAEIDLRETLNEKDYSLDSWEAYETALQNAKSVFDNPEATQAEVDAALKTLEEAYLNLSVDKSKLQAKVEGADSLVESHYSTDSWATYQEALEKAEAVLADPNATQTEVDAALKTLEEAYLNLSVDKSKLQATVEEADSLVDSHYSTDSWTAYQEALEKAEAVLADPNATQTEVDTALKTLEEAYLNLSVDKSKLQAKVEGADSLVESHYSTDSWATYQEALEKAEVVLTDPNATQTEVDAALKTLEEAYLNLSVDKSKLQAKVEEADSLVEPHYSTDSWTAYQEALEKAEAVLADPNATQAEVDAELAKLTEAYYNLTVNKKGLQERVNEAKSLTPSDYSEKSWNVFEKALIEAEKVLNDSNATQDQINDAYTKLVEAYLGLTVDKQALKEQVELGDKLDASDYSKQSWAAYQKALKQAKDVLANPNATQAEVNEALDQLLNTKNNLKEITVENKLPQTSTNLYEWLLLGISLLLVGFVLIITQRKTKA
ncbi:FIVAR domain-containing protein [Ornithinibacillus massiliensis]|uniref:FIVAR domain-containing protein n=1 Tax=Ornithinibacillus massiliensis TaxID=1944633 RepID=A0ABS5MH85_9BACI|nr:SwmB domain-containing protein [Ornithinibacillus massiliensis]MBS3681472.1 FIVAR domain-containing protein [Ornithinibacillus massiliensis]